MSEQKRGVSRRRFLKRVGVSVVGTAAAVPGSLLEQACKDEGSAAPEPAPAAPSVGADSVFIPLNINGKVHTVAVEPRTTLADAMRYGLGMTGTKVVCDRGSCGACTVIADGKTMYSCMMLAMDARGKKIRTVESLASDGRLSPIQAAFVKHDGMMCGYCTPGFIMSCTALLEQNPHPTEEQVRQGVRGNICRCGTYPRIFEACLEAAGARKV
ncbi:MAG TPA: (2Fe-2S)-binding protein [Armatimonadota bacterium]|nr:(2Fe-2S)-binding protein [Armatimonadota bacterium]